MTHQNDFTQVLTLDLINDVLDVGLLPGRHALLLSETGQRQRVDAMAGRTQMRHHIAPRPRSESRTCNEHKVRHGRTVAERPDGRSEILSIHTLEELRSAFAAECEGWAGRPDTFEEFTTLLHEWGDVVTEAARRGRGPVGLP
ncbi:hypothetical protein Sviol_48180 [Streptomyces violascens]|uniref:MarR family transcriptional regulator n=1 Tax=Streptomyces violascens TaxID=67381 RepID=A0ABQ3QT32_9ACTN|nr:hypothetical protein Sviol_48180 [Streptomyces violascens]